MHNIEMDTEYISVTLVDYAIECSERMDKTVLMRTVWTTSMNKKVLVEPFEQRQWSRFRVDENSKKRDSYV